MADDGVPTFHWADYVVWAVSVTLVGFCVAYTRRKQNTLDEYLLGGRDIHPAAIGLSIISSSMNATFLVGGPVEIYVFGAIYCLVGFSWLFSLVTTVFLFLPTFHKMPITSAYQVCNASYCTLAGNPFLFLYSSVCVHTIVIVFTFNVIFTYCSSCYIKPQPVSFIYSMSLSIAKCSCKNRFPTRY